MGKMIALLYGVIAYFLFFGTFLYLVAWVGNMTFEGLIGDFFTITRTVDQSPAAASGLRDALLMNVGLIALFGLQHTVMARPAFKEWWTQFVPKPVERSTYVLLTSLLLILMFYYWRPMPTEFWATSGIVATVLSVIFWLGWLVVFYSTWLIDHFDLFGLKQVLVNFQGKEQPSGGEFKITSLYKIVRHPLMLGWIMIFWAAPVMSQGHLLFAVLMTIYILIALVYEEVDLEDAFGDKYREYKAKVPKIIPFMKP